METDVARRSQSGEEPRMASRLTGVIAIVAGAMVYPFIDPRGIWPALSSLLGHFDGLFLVVMGVEKVGGLLLALALLIVLRRAGGVRRTWNTWFGRSSLGGLPLGMVLAIPIPMAVLLVHGPAFFRSPLGPLWDFSAAIVLMGPPVEEVLFRGFLFGVLCREVRLGPWWALGVTTLLFGLAHVRFGQSLDPLSEAWLPLTFGAGLTLCWTAMKGNGSLWLPIGAHVGWNLCYTVCDVPWDLDRGALDLTLAFSGIASLALTYFVVRLLEERRKTASAVEQAAPA